MSKLFVITCRRAKAMGLNPPRHYGYTLQILPPREFTTEGEDVEGIGWVPHWGGTRHHVQKWQGWYKYRSDAESRANELNRATEH